MNTLTVSDKFKPNFVPLSLDAILLYINDSPALQEFFNTQTASSALDQEKVDQLKHDLPRIEESIAKGTCEGQVLTLLNYIISTQSFSASDLANQLEANYNNIVMYHAIRDFGTSLNIDADIGIFPAITEENPEENESVIYLELGRLLRDPSYFVNEVEQLITQIAEGSDSVFTVHLFGTGLAHVMLLAINAEGNVIGYDSNRATFFDGGIEEVLFNLLIRDELKPILKDFEQEYSKTTKTIGINVEHEIISTFGHDQNNSIYLYWDAKSNNYGAHGSGTEKINKPLYGSNLIDVVNELDISDSLKAKIIAHPFNEQPFDLGILLMEVVVQPYPYAYPISEASFVLHSDITFEALINTFIADSFMDNQTMIKMDEVLDFSGTHLTSHLDDFCDNPATLKHDESFLRANMPAAGVAPINESAYSMASIVLKELPHHEQMI